MLVVTGVSGVYSRVYRNFFATISISFFFTLLLSSFWTKAVATDVVPSPPRFLPLICIADRVQQSVELANFSTTWLTHTVYETKRVSPYALTVVFHWVGVIHDEKSMSTTCRKLSQRLSWQ